MSLCRVTHTIGPWFDHASRALILGSIPSPASRRAGCYYAHPRNRFWPVLALIFEEDEPRTAEERRDFARRHHIALWDVLNSCEIEGARDDSISRPVPNDVMLLLRSAPIDAVFTTGQKAYSLYRRLLYPKTGREAYALPSPSPANAGATLSALAQAYAPIREVCR